jgi:hypothetical protein
VPTSLLGAVDRAYSIALNDGVQDWVPRRQPGAQPEPERRSGKIMLTQGEIQAPPTQQERPNYYGPPRGSHAKEGGQENQGWSSNKRRARTWTPGCWNCQEDGHFARDCPHAKRTKREDPDSGN